MAIKATKTLVKGPLLVAVDLQLTVSSFYQINKAVMSKMFRDLFQKSNFLKLRRFSADAAAVFLRFGGFQVLAHVYKF